jgi:hypothetical protein
MDDIKSVRSNLSIFGSRRVNVMLGFGSKKKDESEDESEEQTLMRHSRYGIGSKRTLEQAEEFTGIDFKKRKMATNRCGNLLWVPYEESSDYGLGEILSRGHAGEEVRPHVVSPEISHSVLQNRLAEDELRASNYIAKVDVATIDYNLVGGFLLVALAVVLKVFTGKKQKDENYKK